VCGGGGGEEGGGQHQYVGHHQVQQDICYATAGYACQARLLCHLAGPMKLSNPYRIHDPPLPLLKPTCRTLHAQALQHWQPPARRVVKHHPTQLHRPLRCPVRRQAPRSALNGAGPVQQRQDALCCCLGAGQLREAHLRVCGCVG
jgi:hypothetical protein